VTYRTTVLVVDFLILSLIFGDPLPAGAITIMRHLIQTLVYGAHENIWSHVSYGKSFGVCLRRRSVLKTVTFRILATINDVILLGLWTNNVSMVVSGSVAIATANTIIYYLHERFWLTYRQKLSTYGTFAQEMFESGRFSEKL
jgi:uncharacterized membrane protein